MNLYTSDGWLNFDKIYNLKANFIFIVGARGIGKTYGALKYLIDNGIFFMMLRRSSTQADAQANPLTSDIAKPLQANDQTFDSEALTKTIKALYISDGEEIANLPFCVTTSVSTGSNLRGFNGDRIDCILYDEFIRQPEEKPIREEGTAFLNLYETISRNRELQGKAPVKALCLANSFNMANELFLKFRLIKQAENMMRKSLDFWHDAKRGVAIIMPCNSPISIQKENTALYKALGDTSDFAQFALENKFQDDFSENIKSLRLNEYKIICVVGEYAIYKHKANGTYYITTHISGTTKNIFGVGTSDIKRFKRQFNFLVIAHLKRNIYFENYLAQIMFDKLMK